MPLPCQIVGQSNTQKLYYRDNIQRYTPITVTQNAPFQTINLTIDHEIVFKPITHRVKFLRREAFCWHPPTFISSDFGHVTRA